LKTFPLYPYAAQYFGTHYLHPQQSAELDRKLIDFLQRDHSASAVGQAMIAETLPKEFRRRGYSQRIPRITGLHLAARFGLSDAFKALAAQERPVAEGQLRPNTAVLG